MENKENVICLRTFSNPLDAEIIKAKLDEFGIECIVTDENLSLVLNPVFSNTENGVKLFIHQSDLEKTNELLKEIMEDTPEIDSEEYWKVVCPSCGSDNVAPADATAPKVGFFKTLLKYATLQSTNKEWDMYKCGSCGNTFKLQ